MIYFLAIVIFAMTFMILHEIKKGFIFRQVEDLRQFVTLKVVLLFAIQILCVVYVVIHT